MAEVATRNYDPHATVDRAIDLARRAHSRLNADGDDGLGRVRFGVNGGGSSSYNRITGRALIGVGGPEALGPNGRLVTLETTIHEIGGHRWFDKRAGYGGLLYGGSSGRLSEGLAQVMAGATLALEGDPAEQAWGWKVLDPRGQATPMQRFPFRTEQVPLSVTMDDVARAGFTLADNGYVHVHSGVVQEGHLQMARSLGMEQMARLTVDTARRELTPVTGIKGWAAATLRTAEQLGPTQSEAVRAAWQAAKVVLPG